LYLYSFEPYFYATKAEKGDGIYSLLRRYQLLDFDCNKEKFLDLNQLEINDPLIVGQEYKLPIKIYEYNGTSIRTTVGINNWDHAVRIQKFNEKILKKRLRRTKYVDSNILWVPYHELACVDEVSGKEKPSLAEKPEASVKKGTYKQVELLGEKYKMVEILSDDLKDQVFYLVAGHGGPDPGAQCSEECAHTISEDEYAYDIVLRLSRYLTAQGGTVHIIIQDKNDGIRDEKYLENDYDETCMGAKIPRDQKKRLWQRANAINDLYKAYKKKGIKTQVALMIHVDSYLNADHSVDTYFYHHKTSKSSKKLAESLQKTFKEKYNHYQKNRGYKGTVKTRNLFMINHTLPTSAYVELGNIQNSFDQKRLLIESNREALAKWLYEGIVAAQL
jgi:N-acetylmuramoyl-L-alanine amidase